MSPEDDELALALANTEVVEELPGGYPAAVTHTVRIVRTLRSMAELEVGLPFWITKSLLPEHSGDKENDRNNGGTHGSN